MIEPTNGNRRHYECRECFAHFHATSHVPRCPDCGGRVRNIAVPRE